MHRASITASQLWGSATRGAAPHARAGWRALACKNGRRLLPGASKPLALTLQSNGRPKDPNTLYLLQV
eukprot:345695-Prorocentrum_lima.AAC.1